MDEQAEAQSRSIVELTIDLLTAYVSNNPLPAADLSGLIATTHAAIADVGRAGTGGGPVVEKPTSAEVRRSITPDALISFLDGRPYMALRRHLRHHGLTPESYRERYGLPRDYPMVSADYSAKRSALAKNQGLGFIRQRASAAEPPAEPVPAPAAEAPAAKPKRAARPRKAQ